MDELKTLIKTSLEKITKDKICIVFDGSEVWKCLTPKPNIMNIGDIGHIYINNKRLEYQLIHIFKNSLYVKEKETILYLIKIVVDK